MVQVRMPDIMREPFPCELLRRFDESGCKRLRLDVLGRVSIPAPVRRACVSN